MRHYPKFNKTALVAWARDEGSVALDSEALEEALSGVLERLKLPRGILSQMTGIKRRLLYPDGTRPSQAAILAAKRLFKKNNFDSNQLDLVYSTSVGRDFLEPSTASIIQSALGLGPKVKNLDLGSACLGFIDGLELAALQIEAGLIDYGLVVAGENSRFLLENTLAQLASPETSVRDFFKNFATLTLGSGGAAMVVGPAKNHPNCPKIRSVVSLSNTKANDLCRGDWTGMQTDSTSLLTAGVALARDTFREGQKNFGWTENYFDLIISHQVSEVNTRKFCESLSLPWDKLLKTYPNFGNMGPVAIPFAFDMAMENNLISPGAKVGLMGIGSGLSAAMMEIEMP